MSWRVTKSSRWASRQLHVRPPTSLTLSSLSIETYSRLSAVSVCSEVSVERRQRSLILLQWPRSALVSAGRRMGDRKLMLLLARDRLVSAGQHSARRPVRHACMCSCCRLVWRSCASAWGRGWVGGQ